MFLHLYVFVCAHAWVCVTSRPAEACVLCVAPGNAGESNLGPWKPTRCAFLHPESWWADFFLINSSPDTTSTSNQAPTHPSLWSKAKALVIHISPIYLEISLCVNCVVLHFSHAIIASLEPYLRLWEKHFFTILFAHEKTTWHTSLSLSLSAVTALTFKID